MRSFLLKRYGLNAQLLVNSDAPACIRNIWVIGTGLFGISQGGPLLDLYGHPSWALTDLRGRDFLRYKLVQLGLQKAKTIERVVYLYHPYRGNYFHFVVQQLLYFTALPPEHQRGILFTGLSSKLKPWQKRYLELLDISTKQFLILNQNYHIKELIVLPQMPALTYSRRQLLVFRNRILMSLKNSPSFSKNQSWKRLFISRADAASRKVLNEKELLDALEPLGFRRVVLSEYSVDEQVALFHYAEFVVAPHGAGNTNILYSQQQTCFIELRLQESAQEDNYYKELASALKLNYQPFYSDYQDYDNNMAFSPAPIVDDLKKRIS